MVRVFDNEFYDCVEREEEKKVRPIAAVKCTSRHTLLTLYIRLGIGSRLSSFREPSILLRDSRACGFGQCSGQAAHTRPSVSLLILDLPPVATPSFSPSLSFARCVSLFFSPPPPLSLFTPSPRVRLFVAPRDRRIPWSRFVTYGAKVINRGCVF